MRVWSAIREAASARGLPVAAFVRRAGALFLETRRAEVAAAAWLAVQRALLLGRLSFPPPSPLADQTQPAYPRPRPSLTR
jgi:hypothetical protein